jgi:hypothetical protein
VKCALLGWFAFKASVAEAAFKASVAEAAVIHEKGTRENDAEENR